MPDGLYGNDALAWAEHQAALLRRQAAGERVGEQVDWSHVIEEVKDLGLSELRACHSLLRRALVHLLKLRNRGISGGCAGPVHSIHASADKRPGSLCQRGHRGAGGCRTRRNAAGVREELSAVGR